jgi:hypothetical protein
MGSVTTTARTKRRLGVTLLALAACCAALTVLAAFTIFGELAAVLTLVCGTAGALLLSRASSQG